MAGLASALLVAASGPAVAAVYRASPDSYRSLLGRLRAGDTLALVAGRVSGRAAPAQFVRRARADRSPSPGRSGGPRRRSSPGPDATPSASSTPVDPVNLPGWCWRATIFQSDAVKAEGHSAWAHHITLEDLVIKGVGPDQSRSAYRPTATAWNWVIRRRDRRRGHGPVPRQLPRQPFIAGVIENNLVVNTLGYNMQIKHQLASPVGIGLPEGRA